MTSLLFFPFDNHSLTFSLKSFSFLKKKLFFDFYFNKKKCFFPAVLYHIFVSTIFSYFSLILIVIPLWWILWLRWKVRKFLISITETTSLPHLISCNANTHPLSFFNKFTSSILLLSLSFSSSSSSLLSLHPLFTHFHYLFTTSSLPLHSFSQPLHSFQQSLH